MAANALHAFSTGGMVAVGGSLSYWYDGDTCSAVNAGGYSIYLTDVWGSSPDDVFAVGKRGVIMHFDGTSWTAMASGAEANFEGYLDLLTLSGTSLGDVYAAGEGGLVLHWPCE